MTKIRVIAEVGTNWAVDDWDGGEEEGQLLVLNAISLAAQAGVSGVKFQLGLENLYSERRAPALWTKMQRYRIPLEWLEGMRAKARSHDLNLWASVFDVRMVEKIAPYLNGLKIASGDMIYDALVKEVLRVARNCSLPVAISTGGATYIEIAHVVNLIYDFGFTEEPILMQCDPHYPAFSQNANLGSLLAYENDGLTLGYSDHTRGDTTAVAAVGMGYTVFEKHFRPYDMALQAPDYWVAIDTQALAEYIRNLKLASVAMGEYPFSRCTSDLSDIRRGSDQLRPMEA